MEKNTTDILRTKALLNFALPLIPKGGKNAPSIYPALKAPILIKNDSLTSEESRAKTPFVNTLYVEWVRSILVEYLKTLFYKGLTVIWIFMTTTSDTHKLFHVWGIHEQFFVLDSSEVRLSFLIKMRVLKLDRRKMHFFASLGKLKQCKVQHCFCSQNVCRVFLFKTILSFTT